jgi:hypothetical protein
MLRPYEGNKSNLEQLDLANVKIRFFQKPT